jgi:putative transposase
MARRPRNYLPGYSYHVVQRGVNRTTTFFDANDYRNYIDLWERYSNAYDLVVHAYCLMPNHIHFLVTPSLKTSISQVTRSVGSRYAARINKKYGRTGTLWEGRHWSSLIADDNYLMRCYQYIESNPVRAGLVKTPSDYFWSSCAANSSGKFDWITPHPLYLGLGDSEEVRADAYCALMKAMSVQSHASNEEFTLGFFANAPVSSPAKIRKLEITHQIKFKTRQRGRPRR